MTGKRNLRQPLPQSGKLDRHAVSRHYSDACECRTCRRLRSTTCAICGARDQPAEVMVTLPSGRSRHAEVMDCFLAILERNKAS